jgi:hypothetical protein
MLLSEGSGGIPDLGWESRPPRLGVAPFEDLSLEDQEIGRGELRVRRHSPSACARCRQPVPHACRRDTDFCRQAQREGLQVLIRPGPYVCAEYDLGGMPWWLLKDRIFAARVPFGGL